MALKINMWTVGPFQTNCYLVFDELTREAVLFDAGMEPELLVQGIGDADVELVSLVNTHGHLDHVAGNQAIKDAFAVPIKIHRDDEALLGAVAMQAQMFGVDAQNSPPADVFIDENDTVKIGQWEFAIYHTPGHCPGSLSFYQPDHNLCLAGDTLFQGSIGRTDLPGGNFEQLADSIRSKLYTLPDDTVVLAGHMGQTTIGAEKKTNPFVRP